MNYAEIESKYPKALAAFDQWYLDYIQERDLNALFTGYIEIQDLPFEYQIGVLEKFFDERGMYVSALPIMQNDLCTGFYYEISGAGIDEASRAYTIRQVAQQAAYESAFSTLESKLP